MCFAWNRCPPQGLALTCVLSRSSPNAKRNEQDQTFVVPPSSYLIANPETILQVTSCNGTFSTGSPPLTRR